MGRKKIKKEKYSEGYVKPLDVIDITGYPRDSQECRKLYKNCNIVWEDDNDE